MQTANQQYDIYNKKKGELLELIRKSFQAINRLEIDTLNDKLTKTETNLKNSAFRVMVIGDFNAGKSTLLNGMLGDLVLPTDVLECTAVITEIKYSVDKYAILHFKNPIPKEIDYNFITPKAKAHIQKYNGKNVPSLKLKIDEIDDFLVIQRDEETMEAKDAVNESPFERMELFWPCKICEEGVEIIDSPGLNATESKEKITVDYLGKIDSLIFILSALRPCSKNEMEFVENKLQAMGFEHTFFVVNRLNMVNGNRKETAEEARRKVLLDCRNKLRSKTKFGDAGVIAVNAYGAEQGRNQNDAKMIAESGINEFESQMATFLSRERGKIKLMHPTKELRNTLLEVLTNIIPVKLKMYEMSVESVQKKYNEIKPQLERLEIRKKQVTAKMNNRISEKQQDIKRLIRERYMEIADNLSGWIDNIEVTKGFNLFKPKESSKAILAELVEKLEPFIANEHKTWNETELKPYVERLISVFNDDFETNLKVICAEIDELKLSISTEMSSGPKTWEKVTSVAAGLLLQNADIAITGGIGGWKSVFTSLGIQAGLLSGMLMLGITNPVTIIPVLLLGSVAALIFRAKGFGRKVINDAKPMIKEEFIKMIPESVDKTTKQILKNFYDQTSAFESALNDEIKVIREQFDSVLREKKNTETSSESKKAALLKLAAELKNNLKETDSINDYLLSI